MASELLGGNIRAAVGLVVAQDRQSLRFFLTGSSKNAAIHY
jgi:hypothetical protein